MSQTDPARIARIARIALVTGGSRGLGEAAALHLADAGLDIVLTYRSSADEAGAVATAIEAKGRRAAVLQLDTADTSGFRAFTERLTAVLEETFGRRAIDCLLNNAGTGAYAPFAEATEADFDAMIAVHAKGTFFLTQTLLPMIEDGGRILNVSSGLARFALPGYAAYGAAKGAVEVMTRYMAKELGPRGIAVNVIAPGAVETDFGGGAVRDNPDLNAYVASQTAMGRAGLPDDIGKAVASILADGSQWMTGQRIEVSGGQSI